MGAEGLRRFKRFGFKFIVNGVASNPFFRMSGSPVYVTMYLWPSMEEHHEPCTRTLRCEIGSNGLHDSMAYYHWIGQEQCQVASQSSPVYVYHGIQKPIDHVGSDLLEVVDIPYTVRSSSPYKWDQLGPWNRIIVPWGDPMPSVPM